MTNASSTRSPSGYARFVATVGERALGARHDAEDERGAELRRPPARRRGRPATAPTTRDRRGRAAAGRARRRRRGRSRLARIGRGRIRRGGQVGERDELVDVAGGVAEQADGEHGPRRTLDARGARRAQRADAHARSRSRCTPCRGPPARGTRTRGCGRAPRRTRRARPRAGCARASGCLWRTPPCNRRGPAALEWSWTRRRHDPNRDHALRHAPPPRHPDAVGRQRRLRARQQRRVLRVLRHGHQRVPHRPGWAGHPRRGPHRPVRRVALPVRPAARVPGGRRRRDARRPPRPVERALRARAVRRRARGARRRGLVRARVRGPRGSGGRRRSPTGCGPRCSG